MINGNIVGLCCVVGCEDRIKTKDRCQSHFYEWREEVAPVVEDGSKWCFLCEEVKAIADFPTSNSKPRPQCKSCISIIQREYREKNPERVRTAWLKFHYGLTLQEYSDMLEACNGRCEVCGDLPAHKGGLHIDHNHETGVVRGMLCFHCNSALGQVREDVERLRALIAYIERHEP